MFLDTHAVVFLHAGRLEQFSPLALHLLEREELLVGPMVLLELQYLAEIGRVTADAQAIVDDLARDIDLKLLDRHWLRITQAARGLGWTRDPFDRLIVAQALVEGGRLLTRDRTIREHCSLAFWE